MKFWAYVKVQQKIKTVVLIKKCILVLHFFSTYETNKNSRKGQVLLRIKTITMETRNQACLCVLCGKHIHAQARA